MYVTNGGFGERPRPGKGLHNAIFNQVLEEANLTGSAREAVSNIVHAALETPVR